MGTCGSNQLDAAVKKDGEQNVKRATVSRAAQREVTHHFDQLTSKFPDYLKDKEQQKMKYIDKKQDDLEERVKQIHRKMETEKPNSVESLEKRQNKPFKQIIGFNKARKDIETYRQKVKKVFSEQQTKLNKDLKIQSDKKKGQIQRSEPQLSNLSRFGVDKKNKALKDQQSKYRGQIEKNNQNIRDEIDRDFGFNKVYKDRFQRKIPDSQLNQILKQFEDNVPEGSQGVGCCS